MEKDLGMLFSELKKELTAYLTVKAKILRLDLFEKTSVTASVLLFGLAVLLIVFFTLFFLFFALGFWLGEIFHSIAAGMAVVTLIYVVLLVIMFACRKKIQAKIVDVFLKELIKNDDDGKEV